jgi:hypothetical protein
MNQDVFCRSLCLSLQAKNIKNNVESIQGNAQAHKKNKRNGIDTRNVGNRNNIIAHKRPILQWRKRNKGRVFADICF